MLQFLTVIKAQVLKEYFLIDAFNAQSEDKTYQDY